MAIHSVRKEQPLRRVRVRKLAIVAARTGNQRIFQVPRPYDVARVPIIIGHEHLHHVVPTVGYVRLILYVRAREEGHPARFPRQHRVRPRIIHVCPCRLQGGRIVHETRVPPVTFPGHTRAAFHQHVPYETGAVHPRLAGPHVAPVIIGVAVWISVVAPIVNSPEIIPRVRLPVHP